MRGNHMRVPLLVAGIAIGLGSMSFQAEAACNARGEFCSYPSWAANAFSAPDDLVPESALDYRTDGSGSGYIAPGYASSYGYIAPGYARGYGYVAAPGYTERRYRRRDLR